MCHDQMMTLLIVVLGDGKCEIHFNKECVGLASRQDKSYLLSLSENKNASSYENVTKKRKRIDAISSKLWHCRLAHISRGTSPY